MREKAPKHNRMREGRIKDKSYMVWMSKNPCLVAGCYNMDIQPHHPINGNKFPSRRQFNKAHDTEVVSLCVKHHRELHTCIHLKATEFQNREERFEEKYALDFLSAVRQYNSEWVE